MESVVGLGMIHTLCTKCNFPDLHETSEVYLSGRAYVFVCVCGGGGGVCQCSPL